MKVLELADEQAQLAEVLDRTTWTLVSGEEVDVYAEMTLDEARSAVTDLLASGDVDLTELKLTQMTHRSRLLTHEEALEAIADDSHWEWSGNTDLGYWYEMGLTEAGADRVGRERAVRARVNVEAEG